MSEIFIFLFGKFLINLIGVGFYFDLSLEKCLSIRYSNKGLLTL